MKALEKDRTRRYETALELAADLEPSPRGELAITDLNLRYLEEKNMLTDCKIIMKTFRRLLNNI